MNVRNSLLLVLLLACGCDEFWPVTVPASDGGAPLAVTRLHRLDSQQWTSLGNNPPLNRVTYDRNQIFYPIAAGVDAGGTAQVTLWREVVRRCRAPDGGGSQDFILLAPRTAEQSGDVGDTVDSGVWTADFLRFRDYEGCDDGMELEWIEYQWAAIAEDYAGNTSSHGISKLRYIPLI